MPEKRKYEHKAPRQPGYCRHGDRAYTRIQGRWINLGTYGTPESKAGYDRQIATWLASGRRLPTPPELEASPTPVTVAEVLAMYWDHAEQKYGKRRSGVKTLSHVKRAISPLREHFGALPAESFGPVALEQLRDIYIANGLSRNTVNDRVRIVKDVFSLAVRRQRVPLSMKHGLAEVKGLQAEESNAPEPKRVKPVPDEYVDAILGSVLPPVRAMIEIQRLTGMRPGEVVIMRASDIDMTGALWSYKPQFHKTMRLGHEREVMLGPKAQEIIRPFLKPDTLAFLFSPRDAVASWQATKRKQRKSGVQPSQKDRSKQHPARKPKASYSVDSYRRAIVRGCDKSFPVPDQIAKEGVEAVEAWVRDHRWHPHQLRHLAATRLRKHYGIEAARIMLGHANIATTELYGERDREVAIRVAGEVG